MHLVLLRRPLLEKNGDLCVASNFSFPDVDFSVAAAATECINLASRLRYHKIFAFHQIFWCAAAASFFLAALRQIANIAV